MLEPRLMPLEGEGRTPAVQVDDHALGTNDPEAEPGGRVGADEETLASRLAMVRGAVVRVRASSLGQCQLDATAGRIEGYNFLLQPPG